MSTGVIRRLVRDRGFGFIKCGEGQEVFFHRSEIQTVPFSSIRKGQSVQFKVGLTPKGLRALDVKPVNERNAMHFA
jgi:CspA family cold shock protein